MTDENQEQNSSNRTPRAGVIRDMGVVDLRFAKSPEDLNDIQMIRDVGVVLIPECAAAALNRIQVSDVGSMVILPSNVPVNCMTGQLKLAGEALAAGDPDTILVIVGQCFVTSTVPSVGYKEVRVVGQILVPRDSQAAFSSKLSQITGQILYVPGGCRTVMGKETIDREFLEYLKEPVPLVIMGKVTFASDVPKELLQAKISEIVLMGKITAPKELISLLNVITSEKLGSIGTDD
ncbi:MAG: hypothetical protein GC165_12125 [Armatimonadetes bacterium]|nr:hypothetical protein [Armatimonadota bacterium]